MNAFCSRILVGNDFIFCSESKRTPDVTFNRPGTFASDVGENSVHNRFYQKENFFGNLQSEDTRYN